MRWKQTGLSEIRSVKLLSLHRIVSYILTVTLKCRLAQPTVVKRLMVSVLESILIQLTNIGQLQATNRCLLQLLARPKDLLLEIDKQVVLVGLNVKRLSI